MGIADGISSHYDERGHQIFRQALPSDYIDALAAAATVVPSYRGEVRRQNGRMEINRFAPETEIVLNAILNPHLSTPSDLQPLNDAARQLVTSDSLWRCLHDLDGAEHYTIHQSILFLASPETSLHIDSWAADSHPLGFAHSVWIPLQNLDRTSGVPCVVPWPRGRLLTETDLGLSPTSDNRYQRYHAALEARLHASSPDLVTALVRRGDVMVWSSSTPHCTMPSMPLQRERLALQIMVRPSHLRCSNFAAGEGWDEDADRITDQFSFLRVAD